MIKILFFSSLIVFTSVQNAYAWGAGMHILEGMFVLNNIRFISPVIMKLLSTFPAYYLYGCISADMFIGKGYKRKDDHCHNWSVGEKMLEASSSLSERAFSYGYLSHLASDIIAHNYYIPNQLYVTSSTKRFGHIYWEFRSDSYVSKIYRKIAMDVITASNTHLDNLMQEIVKKKIVPFAAKKKIYSKAIKMQSLARWQRTVDTISKNSRWEISRNYIRDLHILSVKLIIDSLRNPESAICFKYDPIGADNFTMSKKMRKISKRISGEQPAGKLFKIPEEITSLRPDIEESINIVL